MQRVTEPMLLEGPMHRDNRGYFRRLYGVDFPGAFFKEGPKQVNLSQNVLKGTVRGMHFQHPPEMETKIVSCISGRIFDVLVDIRETSPTYLKWTAYELDEDSGRALVVPEGFAHGFQTLTDDVKIVYFHDHAYVGDLAGRLNPLDPVLAIDWPLAVSEISEADAQAPMLAV
ncbi:dTDP-4-dehydrorhamnose 3,5-epimerase family protein [Thalassobaculum salexigens]|uniref:dTDP-4-dehydrorhamnose 3,5-epimerase family protein n=1 Tax=Thalassobaculum salexigens TaxID=455360 RepID=UPI00048E577C|nr:dTDP-4-dehydrorhamnose 3,5-epimerase family protein [Thalassobaculum salexigens]